MRWVQIDRQQYEPFACEPKLRVLGNAQWQTSPNVKLHYTLKFENDV